jgi:hypothetical protein
VAVTTTEVDRSTIGAANRPDALIVPFVADQVTAGFAALVTVAMNCCVAPELMDAFAGEVETLTGMAVLRV